MTQTLLDRQRRLNKIGIALSQEQDMTRLFELILESAKELTEADGATLYTLGEEKIHFEIMRSETLRAYLGGKQGADIPYPDVPRNDERYIVSYVAKHNKAVNIEDAYTAEGFDFSGTKAFDEKMEYRTRAVLAVPICNHEQEVVAVLQLINPLSGSPFSDEDLELAQSLASQAGVAFSNQELVGSLRTFFESFVSVIAEAIDAKSEITGKHEERVPILTMLLAEAVNTHLGAKTFSEAELYELKVAALLHDCGKITTPSHLLDKKRKLEMVMDRIELVNMRLDLRIKEVEIAHLKNEIDGNTLREEIKQVEQIRTFVERCNKAPLSEQDFCELAALRKTGILSDEEWEHLSIKQGNLTEKERDIIQDHVVVTLKMLSKLKYPKELAHVPEIAASHHERIDGKGYPRGLKGEQLSMQARILSIADIFEALSAPDRPYKKRFSLSKVLNIMNEMCDSGHLDRELFEIFLKEKVHLKYAHRYLSEDQIDIE